jgi:hypothetical protein
MKYVRFGRAGNYKFSHMTVDKNNLQIAQFNHPNTRVSEGTNDEIS